MSAPKLSIITINRNNAVGLKRTLDSIFTQSFQDFESIVIDGASTDKSHEVMKSHRDQIYYMISEPDNGIYDAQNKGTLRARGEYCLYLNSGDFLLSNNILEDVFSNHPGADIVYFDLQITSEEGTGIGKNPEKLRLRHFFGHGIWHQSFIRRKLFTKFGLYDDSYRICGDYEFFVRTILRHRVSTQYIPLTLAGYDTFGISARPEHRRLVEIERKRAQKQNISFWRYWWHFRIRYLVVHKFIKSVLKRWLSKKAYQNFKARIIHH
jgi:glycosyltransferase involved in cell wall biosynthesis